MILRRLAQNLRQQNWTAIVIEFVLLVAGVFLGMQVSNWNEERETREKAEVFMARMDADLRVEAWAYEYLIEYYKDVHVNARRALDGFSGEKPLTDEQLLIAAYRASQYESQDRRRATYDEMVSTGSIGLITDRAMRETAVIIYTTPVIEQTMAEGKTSEYRLIFRRTLPARIQETLLRKCGDRIVMPLDYTGIVHSLDYPCTLGLPADEIRDAVQALRSRPELIEALQMRFADLETLLFNLDEYNTQLRTNLQRFRGPK